MLSDDGEPRHESSHQDSETHSAKAIGLLFIVAMIAYGVGSSMVESTTTAQDFLLTITRKATRAQFVGGCLLMLANSAAVLGIGTLIYPVLKPYNQRMALAYFGTRCVECIILAVGVLSYLSLLPIAEAATAYEKQHSSELAGPSVTRLMGAVAIKGNFWAYQLAMCSLGFGSIPMCYLLWRSALVPGPLAMWGLVGYALFGFGSVLELFGLNVAMIMQIPAGLFELAIAAWLVFKGFAASDSGVALEALEA